MHDALLQARSEPATRPTAAGPPPARICWHGPNDSSRASIEAFIQSVYAAHYGARIAAWTPQLVSLESDGRVLAAADCRSAYTALYLERYLAQPVEVAIAAASGVHIARARIVEVGHLASVRAGAGWQLMLSLAARLALRGFRWIVSTTTGEMRMILDRLDIRPLALGAADPRALGDDALAWGSYYEHAPVVVAGEITGNLQRALDAGA